MPRIRCHYVDCVFLDDEYCGTVAIEIDPGEGCMTYTRPNDISDDDWVDDDLEEWDEIESDDDDLWLDEDEYKSKI